MLAKFLKSQSCSPDPVVIVAVEVIKKDVTVTYLLGRAVPVRIVLGGLEAGAINVDGETVSTISTKVAPLLLIVMNVRTGIVKRDIRVAGAILQCLPKTGSRQSLVFSLCKEATRSRNKDGKGQAVKGNPSSDL